MAMNYISLGAGLAIGLSGLGAAIWEGLLGKAAVEVLWKNPRIQGTLLTYMVLWAALVETAAIYGLIVAFQIIGHPWLDPMNAIGAGLAIWLAAMGMGIGEGYMVGGSLDAINRNPENKNAVVQFMILSTALIETCAIYGLIIAFQLIK